MRPDNDQYFMSIARQVATRSTCNRAQVGAVIVRDDNTIVSTGYNGSPRGQAHCDDIGHLMRDGHCVRALHAEGNALDWAYERLDGYTLYTTHYPCWHCAQRIINRGLRRVVYGEDYRNGNEVASMLRLAGVDLVKVGHVELSDNEKAAIHIRARAKGVQIVDHLQTRKVGE